MQIFSEAISKLFFKIFGAFNSSLSFKDIIKALVDAYHELLIENKNFPVFVIGEIHRNPDFIIGKMYKSPFDLSLIENFFQKHIEKGTIRRIDPIQFMVSLVGITIFPFVGRPVIEGFILKGDKEKMDEFLEERKGFIVEFVLKALDYDEEK